MRKINIAIDGPAGAGKSTIAKLVAARLGFLYIDTGAMYRALTLKALELKIDLQDEKQLNNILNVYPIKLILENEVQAVKIGGEDVTDKIRTPEVTRNVSLVSSHSLVRKSMVKIQRDLAKGSQVVMDGRDIGTNVLPDAHVKIYLTASIEERAKRRFKEMIAKGYQADLKQITEEIAFRDRQDKTRPVAPLKKADDAILIDTSKLTIEQVVVNILKIVREK